MKWSQGLFFSYSCPIDPTPFVKNTVFSLLWTILAPLNSIDRWCTGLFLTIFSSTDLCIYPYTDALFSWLSSLNSSSWNLYCWSSKFVPLSKLFLSILSPFNFHNLQTEYQCLQKKIWMFIKTSFSLSLIPHIQPSTRTWIQLFFPEFYEIRPLLCPCAVFPAEAAIDSHLHPCSRHHNGFPTEFFLVTRGREW